MGVTVGATFKAPEGDNRTSKWITVFYRCVKLFGLGLLLNSAGGLDGDLSNLRIPGVLQYFSIAYLYINVIILVLDSPVGTKSSWGRNTMFYMILGGLSFITYCVLTYGSGEFKGENGETCPGGYLGAGEIKSRSVARMMILVSNSNESRSLLAPRSRWPIWQRSTSIVHGRLPPLR